MPPSGFKHGTAGSVSVAQTGWGDIGGLDKVKRDLQSALLWPSLHPGQYRALDLQRPSGVLLYGPPGCGKTSIVKAMAGMAGATFFYVSAANIFSPYVGDSEKASEWKMRIEDDRLLCLFLRCINSNRFNNFTILSLW